MSEGHVHRWRLGEQNGTAFTEGECSGCGARRAFRSSEQEPGSFQGKMAAAVEERRLVVAPRRVALPERHGTAYRYDMGCRCEPCSVAHREKNRAAKARWQAKQPVAKRARTTTASVEVRQPATAVSIMAGLQASRPSHGEWEARTG